jgi:hypothetical protein
MAAMEPGMDRGTQEPSSHNKNEGNAPRRRIQEVDFEAMNFEQRRAPYNGARKTVSEKRNERPRDSSAP